jgi:chromatin assembly factor 1 subunit B
MLADVAAPKRIVDAYGGLDTVCVAGFSTPVVAVRFCPTLFELKPSESAAVSSPNAVFDLPYRMIFAVATIDSVLIMDTQHLSPLALVGGVHWAAITDLAWAADGRKLVVSSSDGYCSVVLFEQGELGAVMDRAKVPAHVAAVVWPEPRVEKEKEVKEGKATAAAKAEGGENANPNLPPAAATAAQAAPRRITPAAMPTTTTTGASVTGDAGVTGDAAAAAAPRRITSMATSAAAVSTSEATTEGGAKRRIAPVAMDAMPVDATTDDAGAAPSGTQGDGEGEAAAVPAAAAGKKRRIAPMAVVAAADTAAASV